MTTRIDHTLAAAGPGRSCGTTGSRRRPGRTSRTQLKLFEAAMVIMSEKGPTQTTVDEVAAAAGVSKGTVYYNFGSKKSMVEGLMRYGIQLVLEAIEDAGAHVTDPRERLSRGIVAALLFLENHAGFARLTVAEIWRPTGSLSEVMGDQRTNVLERVTDLIQELGTAYRVREHPDPRTLAVSVFGSTFMLAMDREMNGSERTTQEAARGVMTLVDGYIVGPLKERQEKPSRS